MEKTTETLHFKTEEEEANWLDSPAGQAAILSRFQKAKRDGVLGTGTLKKRGLTLPITIRVNPTDVELARVQAEARGLKYQTYLKMVIHQALQKEAAR